MTEKRRRAILRAIPRVPTSLEVPTSLHLPPRLRVSLRQLKLFCLSLPTVVVHVGVVVSPRCLPPPRTPLVPPVGMAIRPRMLPPSCPVAVSHHHLHRLLIVPRPLPLLRGPFFGSMVLHVAEMLQKAAIEPDPDSSPGFYSNMLLVTKTGGFRPLINLKILNLRI